MTVAAYTAVALHTADGSTNWKEQPVGPLAKEAAGLFAVRFSDDQNGWAAGDVRKGGPPEPAVWAYSPR